VLGRNDGNEAWNLRLDKLLGERMTSPDPEDGLLEGGKE
jgi:hypothetical protein